MNIVQTIIDDTVEVTWVDSGVTPTDITAALFTGSEIIVDCGPMTDSGNGHFFRNITLPDSPGFFVAETVAIIDSLPYKRRKRLEAICLEVD